MIIKTRWRDISAEEALRCIAPEQRRYLKHEVWNQWRGKPVSIVTPPLSHGTANMICSGPFYRRADEPEYVVCVHVVEIGD